MRNAQKKRQLRPFKKKICRIKLEILVLQKLAAKEEGQQRKARSKMTSYMYI